jgi:hypothetical protein
MSLEKLVTISSSDKNIDLSESNSDFTVILNERNLSQGVNRILIKECTVPNVFPNIRGPDYRSNQNNIFIINDGVDIPVIVPEGQYVISTLGTPPPNDLLTVLKNLIDAAITPTTVTITLNPITNKLNFTFSAGTYNFVDSTFSLLNDSLGIIGPLPAPAISIDAQSLPDFIHSKDIADLNGVDAGFGLISLAEPVSLVDSPYGSYAYKKNDDDELAAIVYEQPRNLSSIRIVLRDEKGNKLDIGTHEINLVFKAYFDAV